ncbi:hypothetical protein KCU95_g13746, partial [Aureobasidium melanogenum]
MTMDTSIPLLDQLNILLDHLDKNPAFNLKLKRSQPSTKNYQSHFLPFATMNPSDNTQINDSNSDSDNKSSSSNASIPRYGGYKHSSPVYEDFEMWNSVCEDAEPGWEWKESRRLEGKEQKQPKQETKETGQKEKEGEEKEEIAGATRIQSPATALAISRLGSPFVYQKSIHAARSQSQALANTLHDVEESDAKLGDDQSRPNFKHDIQSRQNLALELEQLHIVLVESEDVIEQSQPVRGIGRCVLM